MKKHLFFRNLFISIIILCLFFSDKSFSYAVFSGRNITVKAAASHSNTDIKHAKTLQSGQRYHTSVSSRSFHYYCIPEQEKEGEITIKIFSSKKLSLSFQLYDAKGNLYPSSHYTMDSIHYKLTILYYIPAGKSFLFGLYNDKNELLPYDIIFRGSTKNNKGTNKDTSTKKITEKSKTKKKTLTEKPPAIRTTSPYQLSQKSKKPQCIHTPENNTLKPVKDSKKQAAKVTKKSDKINPLQHQKHNIAPQKTAKKSKNLSLKLNNTFLQKNCGETVILTSTLSGADADSLEWDISTKSHITDKYIHNNKHHSTLKLCFTQKGLYIITCRFNSRPKLSASCTVKIS